MTMALVAKNKLCFVHGSLTQPEIEDSTYGLWSRCNNMVMTWLLHSISKDITESITYLDNEVDMWNGILIDFITAIVLGYFKLNNCLII